MSAFTGNGKPSTTQTLLVAPPVFQVTKTDSYVPAGTVTDSTAVGITCSPPMFPILPQDVDVNAFGPSPPPPSCPVAKADNQTIDVLKALL